MPIKKLISILSLLVSLLIISNCSIQEQFSYTNVKKGYDSFIITARLDGTYYPEQGGDIDNPYDLSIFIRPKHPQAISIKNFSFYSLASNKKPLIELTELELTPSNGVNENGSPEYFYTEFTNLMIKYEDYHITFEVWKNGKHYKVLDIPLKKDFSRRLTSDFLERLSSV